MTPRFLLAAAIVGCLCASVYAQTSPAPINAAEISAAADTYARRDGVPGAIVVITDGPDIVAVHAFGHDSTGQPLTPATRLPIASLSKSFTSLAVMQLVEQGRLDLDAPVTRYLPEFQLDDGRSREITIRQLLAHRSGMSDMTFREKNLSPVPRTLEEAVRALRSATLASAPGERRQYHNANYWVAARLVEVASGLPFATYMRDHVFAPLGMTRSAVVNALGDAPEVAHGHIKVLGYPIVRDEPAWFLGGCCGVITTADDLARWLSFQAQEGRDRTGLVSLKSVRLMHDGLGWNTLESEGDARARTIMHNGILFTFSARQTLLPDAGRGIGIAVVTNTGVGLAPLDADAIAENVSTLVTGSATDQPTRVGLIVDEALTALIVATPLLGWWRVRRLRYRRPARVAVGRRALGSAALVLPILWLTVYPWSLRTLTRRDLNWEQSLDVSPLLLVFVATLAATALVLLVARSRAVS